MSTDAEMQDLTAQESSSSMADDQQLVEFHLSRVIQAHSSDIRALVSAPTASVGLISGSRDGSVRMWIERYAVCNCFKSSTVVRL